MQAPSTTNFYGLLRLNSAPTVREKHTVTGSPSGRRNITIPDQLFRFIGPSAFHQRSYILRGYHDATASGLERLPVPLKTTLSFSIGPFLEPLHHRSPQQSWPYQDRRPAYTLRTFTARQLRIRESASPRYGEPSSQGIVEFSPPVSFSFFTPVAAVDDSLHHPRVRVQSWVLIIFPSITTFSALVLWLAFHLVLFLVRATTRVVLARLHALC